MDKAAGVKYITWDNNQWVSYDDADTLKIKMDFANKLGLGGTMVWALDLDNADSQSAQYLNSGGNMTNTNGFSIAKKAADTQQAVAAKLAFWTPCMTEKERKVLGCPGGKCLYSHLPDLPTALNLPCPFRVPRAASRAWKGVRRGRFQGC
jgi:chitinase